MGLNFVILTKVTSRFLNPRDTYQTVCIDLLEALSSNDHSSHLHAASSSLKAHRLLSGPAPASKATPSRLALLMPLPSGMTPAGPSSLFTAVTSSTQGLGHSLTTRQEQALEYLLSGPSSLCPRVLNLYTTGNWGSVRGCSALSTLSTCLLPDQVQGSTLSSQVTHLRSAESTF